VASIKKLNSYSNVRTVGYILISYAQRPLAYALADVSTYGEWPRSANIAVDGIFFDQVPYKYSAASLEYMRKLDYTARNATGVKGGQTVKKFAQL
jgi:hypothetical protein